MPRAPKILITLALLMVAALYAAWTPVEGLGQLGRDGPRYLMMAEHYSLRHQPDAIHGEMATFSHLPPLYPVLLAWTGSAENLRLAHLVTTGCLLLALLAFFAWSRQVGASPAQAALVALLFAVLPASFMADLLIQSEFLYLLLSLLALTLMSAHARSGRHDLLLAAACAVAAATLARTIGVCLFAPLLLVACRGPWRQGLLALSIAAAPAVLWHLLHHSPLGYGAQLQSVYGHDPLQALAKQLHDELPALRRGFEDNFLRQDALRPAADALGLVLLLSLTWRAIRLEPDAVYLAACSVVVLLWPYPEEAQRFLWVMLPPALLQPLLLLATLRRGRVAEQLAATVVLAAMLLLLLLPTLKLGADRYWSAPYSEVPGARAMISWYGEDEAHSRDAVAAENAFIDAMRLLKDQVPENDCILTTRPDLVNYYARRRSTFPPLNSTPDSEFAAMARRSGCHYVFGMAFKDNIFPETMHPLGRLASDIQPVWVIYLHDDQGRKEVLAGLARLLPEAAPASN